MKDFTRKLAVVTGGGTGMGRELARQLAKEGCHVAMCDVIEENMAETQRLCEAEAPEGTRITSHLCDVSDEAQVVAFREAVVRQHATDHIDLLFNNAGMGGAGSFLNDPRAQWERTFGVCWGGVYHCARAFVPLLVASQEGCLVNTSSVNGFWACLGPNNPNTAYSAAKFAVKGFTESLISDFRANAPHVKAFCVMPGHIGTDIVLNSRRLQGYGAPDDLDAEGLAALRQRLARQGTAVDGLDDEQLKRMVQKRMSAFREQAPMSAAEAATVILDAVRSGRWRILVGEDAKALDQAVRSAPESAYETDFLRARSGSG